MIRSKKQETRGVWSFAIFFEIVIDIVFAIAIEFAIDIDIVIKIDIEFASVKILIQLPLIV